MSHSQLHILLWEDIVALNTLGLNKSLRIYRLSYSILKNWMSISFVHAIWTRLVTQQIQRASWQICKRQQSCLYCMNATGRQSILIFTFLHTIYVKCKFLTSFLIVKSFHKLYYRLCKSYVWNGHQTIHSCYV